MASMNSATNGPCIAPLLRTKYFDEVEARKYFVEPHIMSFANFPNWNGKRVLEIGCGIGTDAINKTEDNIVAGGREIQIQDINFGGIGKKQMGHSSLGGGSLKRASSCNLAARCLHGFLCFGQ
jgi:hypothetical protein